MHYFDDIFENIFLAGAPFVNLFDILLKKRIIIQTFPENGEINI